MDPIPFVQAKWQKVAHRADVQWLVIHTMEMPCRDGIAMRLAERFAHPRLGHKAGCSKKAPIVAGVCQECGAEERRVSAHYCIDPIAVVQCVRETDVAYHCKSANRRGIGIEHAGYGFAGKGHGATDWESDEGSAVLRLSSELAARICHRWSIPPMKLEPAEIVHSRGIIGHVDASKAFATPGGHRDPGPDWPWERYIGMVVSEYARIAPPVP